MMRSPTLADTLWSQSVPRNLLLAVAGSLALVASAKAQVPFWPVPMTMQTFVVLVIGMTFGWRLGAATVLLYLAEGATGLPVFANSPERGIGLAYMVGPTGGYLAGFVLAAAVTGFLAERGFGRTVVSAFAVLLAGVVAIYLPGVLWLGAVVGFDKPLLSLGVLPFLPAELLKVALAAAVLPLAWRFARSDG